MFVRSIYAEQLENGADIGKEEECLSWEMVEQAILRMDGESRTIVTMSGKGERHMTVGFGGAGQYITFLTSDNLTFHNLLGDPGLEGKTRLAIGGQPGYYRSDQIVTLDQALRAACTYYRSGRPDEALTWEII